MNELPKISIITEEIAVFLQALNKQKEEQRLFQFLNGLDDKYGPYRSQLLLMTPLQTVESVCSLIQQEESQNEILEWNQLHCIIEMIMPKDVVNVATKHTPREKCWLVIGYPAWHPKSKKFPRKKIDKNSNI